MSADCYVRHEDGVYQPSALDGWLLNQRCSNATGVQTCCAVGDQCGRDGFCYFTHPDEAPISRYYLGGCTDLAFEDPVCPQSCTGYATQDVVYDSNTGLWSCCWGEDGLDCRNPGNETFAADSPTQLFATTSSSSITKATSTSTGQATMSADSPTSSSLPTSPSQHHDNTTTVAVAAAVPTVLVLTLVAAALYLWRRKWKKRHNAAQAPNQSYDLSGYDHLAFEAKDSPPPQTSGEMPAERETSELPDKPRHDRYQAELPT